MASVRFSEVHTVGDIVPKQLANILVLLALDWTQAAPQSFCLNDAAPENISSMLVTLDTFHFEMSPLNNLAPKNILFIWVTLDTSHFDMSPLNTDVQ